MPDLLSPASKWLYIKSTVAAGVTCLAAWPLEGLWTYFRDMSHEACFCDAQLVGRTQRSIPSLPVGGSRGLRTRRAMHWPRWCLYVH